MSQHHSKDPYWWVLNELRKIPINKRVFISDFEVKDKGLLVQIVKQLICAGWCEYEFTNDYSAIKRLDLPDFARDYFKKMQMELDEKIIVSDNS